MPTMAKKQILRQRPTGFTHGDLEHAAESAREMVAGDSTLQHLVNFLIVARRLYMVGRSALDNEINRGWEVDDPDLIIQVLGASCQEKAMEPFKAAELQQSVLQEIVPIIDILVIQARETGVDIDAEATNEENDGTRPEEECDLSGGSESCEAGDRPPAAGAEEGPAVEG
jgi:hypothetical protein